MTDPSERDTEITPGASASTGVAPLSFATGDIIDGKYRVDRILGEGGMGMVVAATHLHLHQQVALKFMRPEAMGIPDAAARFSREARAAARLRGEHVCRVLDMGQIPGGAPYIVIEHLDGEDLSAKLRRQGRFSATNAVGLVLQAADAMAEAHAAGIVHRDLKPANLFVTIRPDGTPWLKVLDFGVSKLLTTDTSSNLVDTRSHALIGSPLYMAPEQLLSARDADARVDIWALGVILFQLIAGRTPMSGESLPETVAQVLHDDAPRLASAVPGVSPTLDGVVARCLARDRDARYGSVAALASALAPMAPEWAAHLPARIAAVAGMPAAVRAAPRRVIRRSALLAVAGIIAVILGVAVWVGGDDPPATVDEPPAAATDNSRPGAAAPVPGADAAAPVTVIAADADAAPAHPAMTAVDAGVASAKDRPAATGKPRKTPAGHGKKRGSHHRATGGPRAGPDAGASPPMLLEPGAGDSEPGELPDILAPE